MTGMTAMTLDSRMKAPVLKKLKKINAAQHQTLRAAGNGNPKYWDNQPTVGEQALFASFKSEVKDYYRAKQGLMCCYCSVFLHDDHSMFDAEHIIDKSGHSSIMFELNNLAAACRPCNRAKSRKSVLATGVAAPPVPIQDIDYQIVHPHLDDWDDYLEFDEFNRIRAKTHSPKGAFTIRTCKIGVINAARLARYFGKGCGEAEKNLQEFFRYKQKSKKQTHLDLLRKLARRGTKDARAIIKRLEQEVP
ncbi:HNH endonuclease [Paraburkholderia strydomiana]|uniref:HNH endonuclease n=1 Tax=Paraburkholderia strydomiana TaxID=1245417 RepID=A0ABW9EMF8_9BURK